MKRLTGSLTAQLGAFFATVAAIVFSVVGFYLYHALTVQLQERDDADLIERVLQIRHLLEDTSSLASIRIDPHRFHDAVDRRHGLLLVMQSEDGQVLAQNTSERAFTQPGEDVPWNTILTTANMRTMVLANGKTIRTVTAYGVVGRNGKMVRISLARTSDDLQMVLTTYRFKVWAAAITGAILTAVLGYLLALKGLTRVHSLAKQAELITANNLEMRLSVESTPAELRILADSFNEVLDRLQGSFNNLSQFADDLAHDLRTPLNNLMVQTEVAFSQPRTVEEYQNLLASNYEEFGRLARMVESMLFLARADHDQISLSTMMLDTADELTKITEYFEGPASEADIQFKITARGKVLADAHLLRRAISNLVANAIRYAPKNGTISLTAIQGGDGTTISVSNPGSGIDAEHLPKLFVRFYRSDKSRSSKSSSAGLGLAIVKSIMTLHGGSATVQSQPGRSTRFELFFPSDRAR